jgi:FO synthase
VSYAVVRNINYTNMCYFKCGFCAFSKGKHDLRGEPYNIALSEIRARVREAWERGATEVCLQGGIHPDYTGDTYLDILRAVKHEQPAMHVHAFSPLEVSQGAATLGLPVADYLERLKHEGLGSLPGTAAEVLDDEVSYNIYISLLLYLHPYHLLMPGGAMTTTASGRTMTTTTML